MTNGEENQNYGWRDAHSVESPNSSKIFYDYSADQMTQSVTKSKQQSVDDSLNGCQRLHRNHQGGVGGDGYPGYGKSYSCGRCLKWVEIKLILLIN